MINNFDPNQETLEEYLRRIHTNDKLEKTEGNYGKEEKEKKKRSDIS